MTCVRVTIDATMNSYYSHIDQDVISKKSPSLAGNMKLTCQDGHPRTIINLPSPSLSDDSLPLGTSLVTTGCCEPQTLTDLTKHI